HLSPEYFIGPLFVIEGKNQKVAIPSMPGQFRLSIDELIKEAKELYALGVKCVALFPAIDDELMPSHGRQAYNREGLNFRGIRAIKDLILAMLVMGDVALDPYSSEGHDGIVDTKPAEIFTDPNLELLSKQAVCEPEAGADII